MSATTTAQDAPTAQKPTTSIPMTEVAAFQEILKWSIDRPNWQRDSLRRLMINGSLTDDDIDELEAICLSDEVPFLPFSAEHFVQDTGQTSSVSLAEIKNLIGVNALASGQTLAFQNIGLSINGSGKSGYVRVLKSACRTRDQKFSILGDINESAHQPQTAALKFATGDATEEFSWSPDCDGHTALPSISIFDSRSANTHVQATNNVAYTPLPMKLLEQLAGACDLLKDRIKQRAAKIEAETPHIIQSPDLSPTTAAGSFVHNLSEKSDPKTVDLLVTMTEEETRRLTALESDLAQDPKKAAAKINSLRARIERNGKVLNEAAVATSEAAFASSRVLAKEHADAAQLARTTSEELFAQSVLPEIGGDAWKQLWEAARTYAESAAYPGQAWPPPQDVTDAHCVLCHQSLGHEALDRQASFEEFIKGTTKANEQKTKKALSDFREERSKILDSSNFETDFEAFFRDELDDEELGERCKKFAEAAATRLEDLVNGNDPKKAAGIFPESEIKKHINDLIARATQLTADETSEVRRKITEEYWGLKDRQRLGGIHDDVLAEIDRQKNLTKLKKVEKSTAKKAVTTKNKELSDHLVTDALRSRFAREVQKLQIGTTPIELKKVKDSNAQSFFRVEFVGLAGKPVGEILSEGEHRCVALAAFLAELVTSQDYSGIIFDDPMSSLDHLYRRNVAVRLVEEAAHRQVIVFTHDLGFLFELARESEANGTKPHFQHVRRKGEKPGYISDDMPPKAKKAGPIANAIESSLKASKGSFSNMNEVDRVIYSKGVIEQLREVWDQAIADFIRPVLGRFDSQIATSSVFKLAILSDDDVIKITSARARLSEDLHASAEALNPEDVTHEQLSDEVKSALSWIADINQRQKSAAKPAVSYAI